jgi:hypothetical protein
LKPNDIRARRTLGPALGAEQRGELAAELVHVQAGGVDDDLGLGPQVTQHLALGLDAVEQPAVALQRVRAPHALEAAHQRLVGGVEEDQVRVPARLAQGGQTRLQLGVERAGAHVDHCGDPQLDDPGVAHPPGELGHGREQLRRQVVDDVPATVLDDVGGRRPARPAHAGDDDEVVRPWHRRQAASGRLVVSHCPLHRHGPLLRRRRPHRSRG